MRKSFIFRRGYNQPDQNLKWNLFVKSEIVIVMGSFEAPFSMAKMISQSEESKYQVETALEMWNSFT